MKVKANTTNWKTVKTDSLAVFVTSGEWEKQLAALDKMLDGHLVKHLKSTDFKAKEGKTVNLPTFGKLASKSVTIVSLGDKKKIVKNTVRKASAALARSAKANKHQSIAIDCTSEIFESKNPHHVAQAIVQGLILGSYAFDKYKADKSKKGKKLEEAQLLFKSAHLKKATSGTKEGELFAKATNVARDLVNESPSVTTPTYLANVAKKLGKNKNIRVQVLEEKQIEAMGMGAFLSVTRGTDEPPKFIKLTYKGGKKKVVLAGKAITFDTGGLSLKPAKGMETMKLDMAGSASVLGVFSVLSELAPKVEVVGLIAACENMPGPKATKPGDIATAMNGKTIEVLNTDAEGRMTLADMLSYAVKKEKPDQIIDLATLTGACVVALGEEIAGLFANNKDLVKGLLSAAEDQGEKLWEMPLEKDYQDVIKGNVAQLRNIGKSRYGGAVTAALFLQEFVDERPWAHVDIAGPSFYEKDTPLVPMGGTGYGVRTLLSYLLSY